MEEEINILAMVWKNKLNKIEGVKNILDLPPYGFQFFFQNIGPFRNAFIAITIVRVISKLCRFAIVFILSDIISNISEMTVERAMYFYLPIVIALNITGEILDYFTRKYAEALPGNFNDYSQLIIYKKIVQSDFYYLFNYSKESLMNLIGRYIAGVNDFLNNWTWSTVDRTTELVIISVILFIQNPLILVINTFFIGIFMFVSFQQGKTYARIEEEYSKEIIKNNSILQSFLLNLNLIKRLNLDKFFMQQSSEKVQHNWDKFKKVRDNHSYRWFSQLNLFDFIYTATIFYSIYQIINDELPLGFLLLIKWGFDNLWQTTVHYIEVYTSFIKQKEVSKIVNQQFNQILSYDDKAKNKFPANWKTIELNNIVCEFLNTKQENIKIEIPKLSLKQKDKIAIMGESGSGKSTLLGLLLNQIKYRGEYKINGLDAKEIKIRNTDICIINNSDPFFNISILENISLGNKIDKTKLDFLLKKLKIDIFATNLNSVFGSKDLNFSSGQLQRLRLLRGLMVDSKIYLLDEAFNGIDAENKSEIMEFVKDYLADKTLILVTHSSKELVLADKVYKFEDHVLK